MKRFKYLVTLILLSLGLSFSVPAFAGYINGNKLYSDLSSGEAHKRGLAIGYILGVVDTIDGDTACIPQQASSGQLADLIKETLKKVPEHRHNMAAILIEVTLKEYFPCEQSKPSSSKGRGNPV